MPAYSPRSRDDALWRNYGACKSVVARDTRCEQGMWGEGQERRGIRGWGLNSTKSCLRTMKPVTRHRDTLAARVELMAQCPCLLLALDLNLQSVVASNTKSLYKANVLNDVCKMTTDAPYKFLSRYVLMFLQYIPTTLNSRLPAYS